MVIKNSKVSFYIGSLAFGGAERITIYLAEFFSSQGLIVEIITNYSSDKEYIVKDSIKRKVLSDNRKKGDKIKEVLKLRAHLKDSNPDLLIVMNTYLVSNAIISAMGLEIPVIVSERNSPQNFSGKKMVQILSNFFVRFANGFVFQTSGAEQYYHWINQNKVVIPNPLFVDSLPEPYYGLRKKVIVTAGRLHTQKNQKMLIEAFSILHKKFPDYKLIIYGEGNERSNLETLKNKLNLGSSVSIPGAFHDVLLKIREAQMFVLSSDFEGMPNALIEAMALGLPTISTDCPSGGPNDLIEDGKNGLLTDVGNPVMLAKKMEYLLLNTEYAERLGIEAIKIRENLDSQIISQRWLDFSLYIIKKVRGDRNAG